MAGPEDADPPAPPKAPAAPPPDGAVTEWPPTELDPDYPDIEQVVLDGVVLEFGAARTVTLLRGRVKGGAVVADQETPIDACDVVLDGVDLHGLRVQGLTRCHLRGCRLTGADLGDAVIRDVVFEDCALDLVGMRAAQLERVVIDGGRLDGLDLTRARLTDVSIRQVRLAEATTTGIWCVRVDLTGCDLIGVEDLAVLRGCTIGAEQAMALSVRLARGLGMHIAP